MGSQEHSLMALIAFLSCHSVLKILLWLLVVFLIKKKDFIYFRKTLGLCVVVQRISAFTTNSVELKAHFEVHPILAFIS